jgi:pSer/pThr/pTyr-binding forkhead associated (FHA) protein
MPYLVFASPSECRVKFESSAKVYRSECFVVVEADGLVKEEIGVDLTVSRRTSERDAHALLHVEADKVFIKDLGSTNGTYVNGNRLEPYKSIQVSPGDLITIGYYTTGRVEYEVIEGSKRETGDSITVAVALLLRVRKIIKDIYSRNDEEALAEFGGMVSGLKNWLDPCKLELEGVCSVFENAYRYYKNMKSDPNAVVALMNAFLQVLEELDKTLETSLQAYGLRLTK